MNMKAIILNNHEEIIVPREAFITFENEKSYEAAWKLMKVPEEQWMFEKTPLKL